jgi:hypothetical protein
MNPRLLLAASLAALAGCSSVSIGVGLPIGHIGSIGVGVSSDGRVHGGATVGSGGVNVGVSGSGRLDKDKPRPKSVVAPEGAASAAAAEAAASAPATQ